MSSIQRGRAIGPAPWKSIFLKHINTMDSPEFVFSSLQASRGGSPVPYIPRARYCVFRGFWAELQENKHNKAPKNPPVYESEMPTFTSDVRMEKMLQIFHSDSSCAITPEQVEGSGGGGPVEAVWWMKETGTQWRIKGHAFVVGPDIGENEESSGARTTKREIGSRMRIVQPGKEESWSWTTELTSHFGNNSPGIRGSFRAPPPGRPVGEPYNDVELALGTQVTDLHDPVARKNFRVVIIRPDQVEQTDLSNPSQARRFRHTYIRESGEWKTEELWP